MNAIPGPIEFQPTNTHTCPIIGVGASAGGLEAINEVLGPVEGDVHLAFVIVQHLAPDHDSVMAELMDRRTDLTVRQIVGGEIVEPGHAYVIPPGYSLEIHRGKLDLVAFDEPRTVRRPIDDFFHSLATDQGANSACVILSGTGTDGSAGLRAIKERGGICAVQKPTTARFDGMPMSAIATGLVDYIDPPEEIVDRLSAFFQTKTQTETSKKVGSYITDHIDEICEALLKATGHDFSGYKPPTLTRRIERRMFVLEITEVTDYLKRIKVDEVECEALFRDLLINVTNFFRDPKIFDVVNREAIKPLVAQSTAQRPIRIWVPGCSSGEEAFTIAMLFAEEIKTQNVTRSVMIFATDIDDQMLAHARQGRYPVSGLKHLPQKFQDLYVYGSDSHFEITSNIRDMVHFSSHSLIKDPPFSKLDMVSCRNLLIYLGEEIQEAVIPLFHYALREDGYLLLGSSESIGRFETLFDPVSQPARLYRRRPGKGSYPKNFPVTTSIQADRRGRRSPSYISPSAQRMSTNSATDRLLSTYAPAHIITDRHGDVVASRGKLSKYLEFPAGEPTRHLLTLARRDFKDALAALLREAEKTRNRQARRNVDIRSEFGVQSADIVVDPMPNGTMLIVIVEADSFRQEIASDVIDLPKPVDLVHDLEEELRQTRYRLRATVEDLEAANEELKSSNEEMMSMNEELQSSNEELSTVNDELKSKADQLTTVNTDMRHFLESTDFALVVVDRDLKIRNFTHSISEIFPIKHTDRGRRLTDVSPQIDDGKIFTDMREVLKSGEAIQRMVVRKDGSRTYAMQIRPYLTTTKTIEGVTLTFADVSTLEATREELATASERLRTAMAAADMGVWEFDGNTGATQVDDKIREFFGVPLGEEPGLDGFMAQVHPEDREAMTAELNAAVEARKPWRNEFRTPDGRGGWRWLVGAGRVREDGKTVRMYGVNYEVTELREAITARDMLLQEMNHRVKNLFTVISAMIAAIRRETDDPDVLVRRVRARIGALANAHSITQSHHDHFTIALRDLLNAVMEPFSSSHNVVLRGSDVDVATDIITPLGLILYELATNASKYGAFRTPRGQVDIIWSRLTQPEGDELILEWNESGGSEVEAENYDGQGFGSRLLKMSAAQMHGKIDTEWQDGGVRHTLTFPLRK